MASVKRQIQLEGLNERAVEILRLLAQGLTDREIAGRVVMTINTVKWYNRQIYNILGVGSRTQAIARARDLHLLGQDDQVERAPPPVPFTSKQNLPAETTRFIGRKRETGDIRRLLQTARLLTLTGPPGTGKTRLSLHVTREMANSFRDGVYFVSLAPISDPALVVDSVARAIGVNEAHDQPIIEVVKRFLAEKQVLLVMDNFEHLLQAAPLVSELLAATSRLKILATSREALRLYGEQEYAVPLLELPDPEHPDPVALASCESVTLFLERARAVQPQFELTTENTPDIARICVRLEGLPLAIELAAARVKLLPPKALLARLGSRLQALTGGPRDLPSRQQTLRQTISWSYDLLNKHEKTLFARLAVFRGGRSLEAVEAICGPGLSFDPLEGIESLLNKSLLFQQVGRDGEPRFVMLETIHEYAWEQLEAGGEAEAMRWRHAKYFLELAEHAEPELRQAGFQYWMARLEIENDNLRAALEWSLGDKDADVELGLRLVATLHDFWSMSSRFIEGEGWAQRALPKARSASPNMRAKVLNAAGQILSVSNRQLLGKQYLEQAVELAREADDKLTLAWSLIFLGATLIGHRSWYEQALVFTEEGLALFRKLGHKPGMAQALNIIGELTRTNGDDERALTVYDECLLLARETGEKRRASMILGNLGSIAKHSGEVEQAEQLFREALITALEIEYDKYLTITSIIPVAGVIAAKGELERAARLFGAVEALLEPMGVGLQAGDRPDYERDLAFVRAQIDVATFEVCWNEGRSLSLEQVVSYALKLNN